MIASGLIQKPGRVVANIRRRTLTIRGRFGAGPDEISFAMIRDAVEQLGAGPILILLETPGGIVWDTDRAIEHLKEHDGEVRIHVDREASSGGVNLVASFYATCSPDAKFYVHRCEYVGANSNGDPELIDEVRRISDAQTVECLAQKMPMDRQAIQSLISRGETLTARMAKNLGLIDEIVTTNTARVRRMVRSA